MDRYSAMQAFVATCDRGSFSAAGRALNLSATMVAKYVDTIEARLGVRLMQRTTRKITLTEEGRAYRDRAASLLAETDELNRAFGADAVRPHGTLRVNAPLSYGVQRVAPIIATFIDRFSEVRIEAHYLDRVVDVIEEGWDIAIRIASKLPDSSSLISKALGRERLILCAAPVYLERCGKPAQPSALAGHSCLVYGSDLTAGSTNWTFSRRHGSQPGREASVRVQGALSANNGDALRIAALAGHGIILQPAFIVSDDIFTGKLREIKFADYDAGHLTVFVVYARGRHMSAKVRAFVEHATLLLSKVAKAS